MIHLKSSKARVMVVALVCTAVAGVAVAASQFASARKPAPARVIPALTRSGTLSRPVPERSVRICGDTRGARWRVGDSSGARWDVVVTDGTDCAFAARKVPALTHRGSRNSRRLRAPAGWICYPTAISGIDGRPAAGACRNAAGAFFAWRPPAPPATAELDGGS